MHKPPSDVPFLENIYFRTWLAILQQTHALGWTVLRIRGDIRAVISSSVARLNLASYVPK